MIGPYYITNFQSSVGEIIPTGTEILNADNTLTITDPYWFTPYKSSDWPEITTTRDWFFLWSTDHDTGNGGIWWGEADDLDLTNFTELGRVSDAFPIGTQHQVETPFLYRIPTADSGIADEVFLYCHTDAGEPANGGLQQTRLFTTSGGALHTATWTDRGRPLDIASFPAGTEKHSGYFQILGQDSVGNYIGGHLVWGSTNDNKSVFGYSSSSNGITWTFDGVSAQGLYFDNLRLTTSVLSPVFTVAGQKYAIAPLRPVDDQLSYDVSKTQGYSLWRCNDDLIPTEWIRIVYVTDSQLDTPGAGSGGKWFTKRIDNSTMTVYYTEATNDTYRIYKSEWDISNAARL